MTNGEFVTRRECAAVHGGVEKALASLEKQVDHWGKQHGDKLESLNDSVAKNSTFRHQQRAVYAALAFAWATILVPLVGIIISMLT